MRGCGAEGGARRRDCRRGRRRVGGRPGASSGAAQAKGSAAAAQGKPAEERRVLALKRIGQERAKASALRRTSAPSSSCTGRLARRRRRVASQAGRPRLGVSIEWRLGPGDHQARRHGARIRRAQPGQSRVLIRSRLGWLEPVSALFPLFGLLWAGLHPAGAAAPARGRDWLAAEVGSMNGAFERCRGAQPRREGPIGWGGGGEARIACRKHLCSPAAGVGGDGGDGGMRQCCGAARRAADPRWRRWWVAARHDVMAYCRTSAAAAPRPAALARGVSHRPDHWSGAPSPQLVSPAHDHNTAHARSNSSPLSRFPRHPARPHFLFRRVDGRFPSAMASFTESECINIHSRRAPPAS